jgi:hypothetical protein
MKKIKLMIVLLFLSTGTVMAQQAKAHRSYRKILRKFPAEKF